MLRTDGARWGRLLVTIGALALLSMPALARAQGDPPNVVEAREHLNRGTQLLDQENYDAALAEFERAYELVGEHPARHMILYNIARAHERMFRYDLALEYYARYLAEAPADAPQRGEVQGTMRALEGFLATLQITSNVPAEVWVDNRRVGDAPGPVRVPGGRHVVELRASGYSESRQEVQIAARETQAMSFTLSGLAGEYHGISPVFFYGATGLAIAALLAGGGVGIAAVLRRSEVDGLDSVERLDGGRMQAARDEIAGYQLTADVLFGATGLFAVTALVLAFLSDFGGAPAEAEPASAWITPVLSPDTSGVVVGGSF